MKKSILLLFIFATLGLASCNWDRFKDHAATSQAPEFDAAKQAATDDSVIQAYIKKHHIPAVKHPSGLYYQIINPGNGRAATETSTVQVNYEGKLPDETIFDQTNGHPATLPLNGVIPGWTKGIPLIKTGGKILLLIPSALGYGQQASGPIPANSVLIFNVELLAVQ